MLKLEIYKRCCTSAVGQYEKQHTTIKHILIGQDNTLHKSGVSEQVNQMIQNNRYGVNTNRHQFRIDETKLSHIANHAMKIEQGLAEVPKDKKQPAEAHHGKDEQDRNYMRRGKTDSRSSQ